MELINWDVLKQPYNWAIVFVITAFALLFLNTVMPEPRNSAQS